MLLRLQLNSVFSVSDSLGVTLLRLQINSVVFSVLCNNSLVVEGLRVVENCVFRQVCLMFSITQFLITLI